MAETTRTETFEDYRTYLFAIAYRMLGSAMDAEDMVQDTYLRFQATRADVRESIVSLKAYLTTILTRLCVNQLQSARRKRERYPGPWLPEPISTDHLAVPASSESANPEERMELYESLALAFLVLLEELGPIERAVFLLRDVFDYEYAEIAEILGKSEAACRQAFSRAKRHLAEHRPRVTPAPENQRELLTSFLHAVQGGDMVTLMAMLAEDATLTTDGGGKVRGAATRLLVGRAAVARMSVGTMRFLPEGYTSAVVEINGQPALVIRAGGQSVSVVSVELDGQRIRAVRVIANPDKLQRV
ncbi:MAG TPA: RNA polymerase sigma-70 factor [Ktedonobacterales bacterium]|jgi:RNA polymerase sigma-70 factor (ECF subfamily)